MIASREKIIRVGFRRDPRKIFDEIEALSAEMIRTGWHLKETCFEESMAFVHLFFEKEVNNDEEFSGRR